MNLNNPLFFSNVRLLFRVLLLSIFCFGLVACFPGVYKLSIPQGNIIEEEKIDQLVEGMTKRQVRYLLGTPLVMDSFNQNRWDYYYSIKYYRPRDSEGTFYQSKVVLTFDKGLLAKIEKDIPKTEKDTDKEADLKKQDVSVPEAAE